MNTRKVQRQQERLRNLIWCTKQIDPDEWSPSTWSTCSIGAYIKYNPTCKFRLKPSRYGHDLISTRPSKDCDDILDELTEYFGMPYTELYDSPTPKYAIDQYKEYLK